MSQITSISHSFLEDSKMNILVQYIMPRIEKITKSLVKVKNTTKELQKNILLRETSIET